MFSKCLSGTKRSLFRVFLFLTGLIRLHFSSVQTMWWPQLEPGSSAQNLWCGSLQDGQWISESGPWWTWTWFLSRAQDQTAFGLADASKVALAKLLRVARQPSMEVEQPTWCQGPRAAGGTPAQSCRVQSPYTEWCGACWSHSPRGLAALGLENLARMMVPKMSGATSLEH